MNSKKHGNQNSFLGDYSNVEATVIHAVYSYQINRQPKNEYFGGVSLPELASELNFNFGYLRQIIHRIKKKNDILKKSGFSFVELERYSIDEDGNKIPAMPYTTSFYRLTSDGLEYVKRAIDTTKQNWF